MENVSSVEQNNLLRLLPYCRLVNEQSLSIQNLLFQRCLLFLCCVFLTDTNEVLNEDALDANNKKGFSVAAPALFVDRLLIVIALVTAAAVLARIIQ
mmetsp:Transcript_6414/g.9343  ORF Transcript_6414/g.9343 Transcript_6414/m.9343 type:complete len:97 (+) Transcript_6414:1572-1862(+)